MHIVNLQMENLKRVVAIEIAPTEPLVEITGRNGAGKTSVLDGIWWGLAGTRAHQPEPIRRGASSARIRLDLGELVVTREFTKRPPAPGKSDERMTTRIKVESADGAVFGSPQKVLDDLFDSLSFDPLKFARMDPKAQYQSLRDLVGVNLDDLTEANGADFEARTLENRIAKDRRAAAAAVTVPEAAQDAPVAVDTLLADLTTADVHNATRSEAMTKARRLKDALTRSDQAFEAAEATVTALKLELAEATTASKAALTAKRKAAKAYEARETIPELVDTAPIHDAIRGAERRNQAIAAARTIAERKAELDEEATAAEIKALSLTDRMGLRNADAKTRLEAADMPVPGLSLEHGMVTFNGAPFEQASDAEQLRVSCAIAMRGNAKLKVIRVRNGSLLDDASLEVLRTMAAEHDYQVWIERVDSSGTVGFVIEDGRLAA